MRQHKHEFILQYKQCRNLRFCFALNIDINFSKITIILVRSIKRETKIRVKYSHFRSILSYLLFIKNKSNTQNYKVDMEDTYFDVIIFKIDDTGTLQKTAQNFC